MASTLAQLKQRVLERADMEGTDFISDSELLTYINESYAELYDIMVASFEDYFTIESALVASGGTGRLTLPTDFYKLRGLDKDLGGGNHATVYKFNFNDRNVTESNPFRLTSAYGLRTEYRIVKDELLLVPAQPADGTYRMWYIPQITFLAGDSDTVDAPNGFDEYIVIDAAIKCLTKEESDTGALDRAKGLMTQRINDMSSNRDTDQPEVITDINSDLTRWYQEQS